MPKRVQALGAWEKFLADAPGSDDGWLAATSELPLQVRVSAEPPKRFLYLTKQVLYTRHLIQSGQLQPSTGVIVRGALPTKEHCRVIRALSRLYHAKVSFCGDLEPYSLSIYAILREYMATARFALEYTGVNDSWLARAERALRKRPSGDYSDVASLSYSLTPFQREHVEVLFATFPLLLRTIGDQAAALLRGGRAVSTDMLLSTNIFSTSYVMERVRTLLDAE